MDGGADAGVERDIEFDWDDCGEWWNAEGVEVRDSLVALEEGAAAQEVGVGWGAEGEGLEDREADAAVCAGDEDYLC